MYQCISSFEPFRVRTSGLVAGILTGAAGAGLLAEPSFAMAGADNSQTLANPTIAAQPFGPDLDGNQIVDMKDLMIMLAVLNGGDHANPAWVQSADVNGDGVIDHADLSEVIANFGRTITPPPPPPPTIPSGTISRTREATGSPGVIRPITPPPPPPPPPLVRLIPGDGFWGPTLAPEMIGNPARPGADAKAIARWDVVPYQTISGQFTVGVVAFHMNGIDRVSFSANGGEWVDITEMTLNPRTDVYEYWVTVDAADFQDGLTEIRAVVYPKTAGIPRVLGGEINSASLKNGEHSIFLSMNAGGTLPSPVRYVSGNGSDETGDGSRDNPFRTPYFALQSIQRAAGNSVSDACDGAIIYCLPGEYTWGPATSPLPRTLNRWATVTPAPDVSRDDVIFNNYTGGGFRTRLITAKNIRTEGGMVFRSSNPSGSTDKFLWVNNTEIVGPGRLVADTPLLGHVWTGMWVTDTTVRDVRDACQHAIIARNVHASAISCDAFSMSPLVVNSSIHDIDNAGTTNHPDILQFKGSENIDNHIVYGLRATAIKAQGIFARGPERVDNIAFVNALLERDPELQTAGKASQWMDVATNHLLMIGVSMPNYTFSWRTSALHNIYIRGSVFHKMNVGSTGTGGSAIISDSWFRNNHFIDASSFGARVAGLDATTGDPKFVNALSKDFRPGPGSPLKSRVQNPLMRNDAQGVQRGATASVGAYEPDID
ncbi:MAG: dockerin type I repeat-containing protein [Phycisphaeraceae bacterium]|nr:dockerin type I repeat-containing protein [Phycisphaeraceae bacterium]